MKVVVQRVKSAKVEVEGKIVGAIEKGLLIFLGVSKDDTQRDAEFLAKKVAELRIFEDGEGKMNLSVLDTKGQALVVSQFTLYGNCQKGRRPSFNEAAQPEVAVPLYEYFVKQLELLGLVVGTGQFQAMMDVSLVNDGPVTLILESNK
ncbi:MAG: D-tyrosyl-tRNA(Tyr) deacylase [Lysobacterales bacterium]|jgi:D-tyrosyl-tRNA(Tyr) deacylase